MKRVFRMIFTNQRERICVVYHLVNFVSKLDSSKLVEFKAEEIISLIKVSSCT